ncbi:DUF4373 domain-containing protein [Bacteroides xylanisolvens]|nr:DUF4373 domain-containing protein [Bacteroides xylanisolvens]
MKKRYGCEGYALYQYIQNEIYRVERRLYPFHGRPAF